MAKSDDVPSEEVPDGTAFFPEIPAELGVSPLLLSVLHSVVFLGGSAEEIVHPTAGDEALGMIAEYLARLDGAERAKVIEDMDALRGYARDQGWPKQLTAFLKSFLTDFGIESSDT